jgi:predicted DNA-binding protein with PD1-like motif
MQIVLEQGPHKILRFDRGEALLLILKEYCMRENIMCATVSAIGAAEKLTLSWYDADTKTYTDREFDEKLEIVSLSGNISTMDGKPVVHLHGSFGNRDMQMFGGHLKMLIVGATCELKLMVMPFVLPRDFNEEVGLHLFVEGSAV